MPRRPIVPNKQAILSACLLVVCSLLLIFTCVHVTFVVGSSSSSGGNGTLREWLGDLNEQAARLQSTALKLQVAIAVLSNSNNTESILTIRSAQLKKITQALNLINQEIVIVNSACSNYDGPDCNIPICDSKCLNCSSPGKCVSCSGNWTGPSCSIPVCDSKCLNCTSPGNCSVCSGNWNGTTCSTCKSGWTGTNCVNQTAILTSAQMTRFSNEILNMPNSFTKLLFKASRDGFAGDKFHSKCDNKGATVVIVKAQSGAIFGGYTSVSWNVQNSGYVSDKSAFLFSLVSSTGVERFAKLPQQYSDFYKSGKTNGEYATYQVSGLGPTFGGGHDLFISNNCNSNSLSTSNLCASYCDATMSVSSTTANAYLAGTKNFQVEDYEVYNL
ncbi:predicted protein [Naegleria gruberi]|uniref:Predicted protein n=1 Tax=Naegleria gruberi TaxID=5762 RepID=D2V6A3_NAEGR|nr:uncharacterized protein NAEGRDRAFT_64363 [Naegleria gruberi]EFC47537.1 predicted protein [Naegleria gruberi]|eukprot:XP_002680281.1 predicted protein [Naegleria gruberi strain NEG-M]